MASNNLRDAIFDMASGLKGVFKDYSLSARRRAWKKLTGSKGKAEIEKLLTNPNRPLNRVQILQFSEWLQDKEN